MNFAPTTERSEVEEIVRIDIKGAQGENAEPVGAESAPGRAASPEAAR